MTHLSSQSIRARCIENRWDRAMHGDTRAVWEPMIDPFVPRTLHPESGTSYGLGPDTYDVRVKKGRTIMPGEFVRLSTVERFVMPHDVGGQVMDKSTLARHGLNFFTTHIDPGWCGWLTLEGVNHGPDPITFGDGWPIAQIMFDPLDEPTEQPYVGKYLNQPDRPVEAIHEVRQ